MADRGEYRGIYVAEVDDPQFQEFTAPARLCYFVLRLRLGQAGIAVFYPEVLPRLTGHTDADCAAGVAELKAAGWLRVERTIHWLKDALRNEPSDPLASPNQRKGIERHIRSLAPLAIVSEFAAYYGLGEPFRSPSETLPEPDASPFEARKTEDGRRKTEDGEGDGPQAPAAPLAVVGLMDDGRAYLLACLVAANRAGHANPKLASYREILEGHGASVQSAADWRADGIPLELAVEAIAEVGGAYAPSRGNRQYNSLSYFDGPVRNKHAARQREAVEGSDHVALVRGDPEPGTPAARVVEVLATVADRTARRMQARGALRHAIDVVFGYWQAKTGQPVDRTFLDETREAEIRRPLEANGGDVGELLYTIDGACVDTYHNGEKDGVRRLQIACIFRNRATIEELAQKRPGYLRGDPHPVIAKLRAEESGA